MATTVNIPLAISTAFLGDSNAHYKPIDGTQFDYGVYNFVDTATAAIYFWGIIPPNVAATPAWNMIVWSKAASGSGGDVVLTVKAKDYPTNTAFDAALTALVTTTAYTISTSANTTKTTLSGTNFDSTEAVAAGNLLFVEFSRIGGNASDTLNTDWWLLSPPILQIDIT